MLLMALETIINVKIYNDVEMKKIPLEISETLALLPHSEPYDDDNNDKNRSQ